MDNVNGSRAPGVFEKVRTRYGPVTLHKLYATCCVTFEVGGNNVRDNVKAVFPRCRSARVRLAPIDHNNHRRMSGATCRHFTLRRAAAAALNSSIIN